MTVWNQMKLKPPSRSTILYLRSELVFDNLKKFVIQLKGAVNYLKSQRKLFSEVSLMQKVVVKLKHRFRHEKFLQGMQKVYKCFQRLQEVNLKSVLEEFIKLFPDEWNDPNMIDVIYLPSKQTLEFVLVRLMGLALLVDKIMIYCQEVFHFSMQQIQINVFIPTHLMILGIISRIWILAKAFLNGLIKWYNIFRPWRERLKGTNAIWISDELPKDLAHFLVEANASKVNSDSFADDLASSKLSMLDQISAMMDSSSLPEAADMIPSVLNTVDLGEIISRDSIVQLFKANQQEFEKKIQPKKSTIRPSVKETNYQETTDKMKYHGVLSSKTPIISESWEIKDLISDEDSDIQEITIIKKTKSERRQSENETANKKKQTCENKTAVHIQDDIIKKLSRTKVIKKISESGAKRVRDREVIEECAYIKSKKIKKNNDAKQKRPVNLTNEKYINPQKRVSKFVSIKKKDRKQKIITTSADQLPISDEKIHNKYQDSKLSFSDTYKTKSSIKKANQYISKQEVVTAVNNLNKISEIKNLYRNVKNQQPFLYGDVIGNNLPKKSLKPLCRNLKRMLQRLKLNRMENKSLLSKVIIQEKRKLVKCIYEILK